MCSSEEQKNLMKKESKRARIIDVLADSLARLAFCSPRRFPILEF